MLKRLISDRILEPQKPIVLIRTNCKRATEVALCHIVPVYHMTY